MSTNDTHILTLGRDADLTRVIGALDGVEVSVVRIEVEDATSAACTRHVTVVPRVPIGLPVYECAVRRAGTTLLDLRLGRHMPVAC